MDHQAGTRVLVLFTKPTWPAAKSSLLEGPQYRRASFCTLSAYCVPGAVPGTRERWSRWRETGPQIRRPVLGDKGYTRMQEVQDAPALASDGEMIKEGSSGEVMLEVGFEGRIRIFQSDQREEGKASEARHKRWK